MRTLTILRRKSSVGCLGKMKVYAEDPNSSDLVINGVACRKLGVLKNGETVDFIIDDEATRIYVVADKLSKNISNEFYSVPAGSEDVFLSGQNHYNPFAGNPFYFDGVTDAEALKNRKKGKRKSLLLILASVIVGLIIGLSSTKLLVSQPEPQTFSNKGMTIVLTDEFEKSNYEGFTICYESRDAAVFVIKELRSELGEYKDSTVEQYGELVIDTNGMDSTVNTSDGLVWFEFTATGEGDEYYYFCSCYKTDTAFWLLQFTCRADEAAEFEDDFVQWAQSVTFG